MKTAFQPISELALLLPAGERIVVGAGEKKVLSFGIDAQAGEKKELLLAIDVFEDSELEVAVFARGAGEISVHRTVNVLGKGASVVLRCAGIMEGTGRISASDDVRSNYEGCKIDLRTKFVLGDSAVSEVRSRITLGHESAGTTASAKIDNLLLSDTAKASFIPELDVKCDNVICGHSASCSSLTPASLTYLEGRGIDRDTAMKLLVHGFLYE
ncbi:MAG: SufD family Fe-S cluster assembly protein [Patescibacteria group bacterium]|jgi:Fe-S cluster assembly protein SufD